MLVEKLNGVDAFVVFDLEDAPCSFGVVRSAPKILVDGATWLARSQTYQLASFEHRAGGASAGVNARPDQRDEALAAFVTEVQPWVASRRLVPDPAKGVRPQDLEGLRTDDARPAEYWEQRPELLAIGVIAAADAALGGLEGRSVAIEGFDEGGVALARAAVEAGASLTAIGSTSGTARQPEGFSLDAVRGAWDQRGADLVHELAMEPGPPGEVFGVDVDVLVCGSKAGVVDHGVAAGCGAHVLVPSGPIPVTTKGLAVLRRADVCVLPDFVTTAGPLLGAGVVALDGSRPAPTATEVATMIGASITEVLDDDAGPLLAACRRAESFLRTWRDGLPFGRPLA